MLKKVTWRKTSFPKMALDLFFFHWASPQCARKILVTAGISRQLACSQSRESIKGEEHVRGNVFQRWPSSPALHHVLQNTQISTVRTGCSWMVLVSIISSTWMLHLKIFRNMNVAWKLHCIMQSGTTEAFYIWIYTHIQLLCEIPRGLALNYHSNRPETKNTIWRTRFQNKDGAKH